MMIDFAGLAALIRPQAEARALDLATPAGALGLLLAPHAAHVTLRAPAGAIPPLRLALAADPVAVHKVSLETAVSPGLPYPAAHFDLVTCCGAARYPPADPFPAEVARVLKPDGRLLLVDFSVPGSRLRGKKARALREAGRYVNAFLRLRDPRQQPCLSQDGWEEALRAAGFAVQQVETQPQPLDFDAWTADPALETAVRTRLRAMLLQAPSQAADYLTPTQAGTRIEFHLHRLIILATRADPPQP